MALCIILMAPIIIINYSNDLKPEVGASLNIDTYTIVW